MKHVEVIHLDGATEDHVDDMLVLVIAPDSVNGNGEALLTGIVFRLFAVNTNRISCVIILLRLHSIYTFCKPKLNRRWLRPKPFEAE